MDHGTFTHEDPYDPYEDNSPMFDPSQCGKPCPNIGTEQCMHQPGEVRWCTMACRDSKQHIPPGYSGIWRHKESKRGLFVWPHSFAEATPEGKIYAVWVDGRSWVMTPEELKKNFERVTEIK